MRKRLRHLAIGAGFLLGASAATVMAAVTLDVKMGLWEISSIGETTGRPPIPAEALARLTPEQRAQVEASIAAAMGSSRKPLVHRACLTQKALERGLSFDDKERNCRKTITNSTSRLLDMTMECTGRETASGTFHFEAVNRETIRGNVNVVMSNGTDTMTMKRTVNGKWLSNDCGNVKPNEGG